MPGGYWSCLCFPLVNTVWSRWRWRWRLCKWCFELSSHWKDGQLSVENLPLLYFPFFCHVTKFRLAGSQLLQVTWTLHFKHPPPSLALSLSPPHFLGLTLPFFPCFLVFYVRICIFTKSCSRWQSSSSFSSKRCITTYTRADCEREEERERKRREPEKGDGRCWSTAVQIN